MLVNGQIVGSESLFSSLGRVFFLRNLAVKWRVLNIERQTQDHT